MYPHISALEMILGITNVITFESFASAPISDYAIITSRYDTVIKMCGWIEPITWLWDQNTPTSISIKVIFMNKLVTLFRF